MADFTAANHGTVWTIKAVSDEAKSFADTNFAVEDWMGVSSNFTTDWRPARDIANNLEAAGFEVEYV